MPPHQFFPRRRRSCRLHRLTKSAITQHREIWAAWRFYCTIPIHLTNNQGAAVGDQRVIWSKHHQLSEHNDLTTRDPLAGHTKQISFSFFLHFVASFFDCRVQWGAKFQRSHRQNLVVEPLKNKVSHWSILLFHSKIWTAGINVILSIFCRALLCQWGEFEESTCQYQLRGTSSKWEPLSGRSVCSWKRHPWICSRVGN